MQFVVPEEGSTLFIDNLVIPSSARRADLAHQFIDYLMQPQVAAQISSETLYPSANLGAQQFLEPKLREQLGRNLASAKNRLFALMPLSDKLKKRAEAERSLDPFPRRQLNLGALEHLRHDKRQVPRHHR